MTEETLPTETVAQVEPQQGQPGQPVMPQIGLNLQYDEAQEKFVMTYLEVMGENKKVIFSIVMCPAEFDRLTSNMVRCVKDFNLMKAELFQKARDEKKALEEQQKSEGCTDGCGNAESAPTAEEPAKEESAEPQV